MSGLGCLWRSLLLPQRKQKNYYPPHPPPPPPPPPPLKIYGQVLLLKSHVQMIFIIYANVAQTYRWTWGKRRRKRWKRQQSARRYGTSYLTFTFRTFLYSWFACCVITTMFVDFSKIFLTLLAVFWCPKIIGNPDLYQQERRYPLQRNLYNLGYTAV